jgi:thiol-disulfide isomerase/thioredoxin
MIIVAACSREQTAPAPAMAKKPASPGVTTAPPATETTAGTQPGDLMPPYSSKYLDGKPFDLRAEKGNVVFVNVWATWCGPCRFEIPQLQALHDKYAQRGFKVVGVSVDESGADVVKQFVIEQKMSYPIAVDAEGRIANVLQTTVLPTSVIIDRSGRIIWRKVGAVVPNEAAELNAVIGHALGQS